MPPDENDIFLVFLERGDDPLTNYGIAQALGENPHDPEREVSNVVARMVKNEILVEFDIEHDALDDVIIERDKYGPLDNSDLSYVLTGNLYGLGPKCLEFVDDRKSQLMMEAADRGLVNALQRLRNLRVDSSSWTGLPAGFSFTPQVQARVVQLLGRAISEVDKSDLGNNAKAQTSAYLRAALVLAEAPDPPPDLVAELLRRIRYAGELVGFLSSMTGLLSIFGIRS